jgi:DNA-binding Lrp family transcriptional regulator
MLKLDDKDFKILQVMRQNADYPTRKIAKKTLLPITTVHNRLRRLRQDGVIKKYTVELDYGKIGKPFAAYVLVSVDINLLKQKKKTQYDVIDEVRRFYFVEKADIVTGGTDIIVFMRVKDVGEFDSCLLTKLQIVEGIEKTQSLIVIH